VISPDVVNFTASGTFSQSTVGAGIAITSTSTIDNTNYSLTQPLLTARDITAKPLTLTGVTTSNKVYDRTNTATLTGGTLDGVISPDVVNFTASGTFSQSTVGAGIAITSTSTIDNTNYSLTQPTLTARDITAKPITVTGVTTSNKVYDRTNVATLTGGALNGVISPDVVNFTASGTFSQSTVGAGIVITSTSTIDNTNYSLTQPTLTARDITAKPIILNLVLVDKQYDGNTTATATLTDNKISGDDLTVNKTGATFNNKNIGIGKTVTINGISLTGTDAGNYTLTSSTATGTASITVKSLTISATALNKVYDGNTNATVTLTDNRISGDDLTVNNTATFNNKNIGTGKAVAVSGITLTGTDAGNYTLTSATATGTASITVKSLTITATATDKVYDGNTTATASLTDNKISGDDLTVNKTGATFNNKNIGTGKTVTVSGITLTGADAGNYTLTTATAAGTASITVKSLNITATALDKVYDGNANATATLTDNKLTGDDLTLNKTGVTFNNKNVGSGKTFTVTGITLTGTDAGNYTITNATATGTASITAKILTITAIAANKEYDGNVNAVVVFSDNRISGDVLTVNKTGSKFNDKNTGVGKAINITGINLTGVDAGNYSLTSSTITGTASITARGITISAIAMSKPYDGNKIAAVTLSDDKISGDIITPLYTLAEFDTKEIGNNKTVTVTGISIQGLDVLNYNLNNTTATAFANIIGNPNAILILPNAFTPNGDGVNDIFKIASYNSLGRDSFRYFEIYDRNGKLMRKRFNNIDEGWDGRLDNGAMQDMGIYFVKLVKLKDGKEVAETTPFYLLK
jgi:trimeric autotransporter adhesin